MLHSVADSLLVVVDVQTKFMTAIEHADRVIGRTKFLVDCANELGVKVIATEQNPDRLGATTTEIDLRSPAIPKMEFGAWQNSDFRKSVREAQVRQVIVCGVEAHICVLQTAIDLFETGDFQVSVVLDAVGSRTTDRLETGIAAMRSTGIRVTHSESVVYEWMRGASHPKFKTILEHVKSAPN